MWQRTPTNSTTAGAVVVGTQAGTMGGKSQLIHRALRWGHPRQHPSSQPAHLLLRRLAARLPAWASSPR
jgi:hypothetical protein